MTRALLQLKKKLLGYLENAKLYSIPLVNTCFMRRRNPDAAQNLLVRKRSFLTTHA
jgi:hypothetical protein